MEGWSLKADANDDQKLTASTDVNSLAREITETPGRFDVLLGRGKIHTEHRGNERLHTALRIQSVRYSSATSRHEKTAIIQEIVQSIHNESTPPGRFLEFDKDANGWVEVDDAAARKKVSQAIQYASRHKKGKAPPKSVEPSSAEPATLRSDYASHPDTVRGSHQQERSGGRSPLVSDESILAGLGYDIHSIRNYEDS
jgi:hypothetical protein